MQLKVEITGLSAREFEVAQKIVKAEYRFRDDEVGRVCLVFGTDDEERHAEMPLPDFANLLQAFLMIPGADRLQENLRQLGEAVRTFGQVTAGLPAIGDHRRPRQRPE